MAPRKPTATAKPAQKRTTGKSHKIVKRPAHGYHTYKNGLLNVTPKGDEKELVERNSKSPLLSLPTEIHTRIWEYTLGHSVHRARLGYF
ncbi:hypothetical protein E8E11_008995 [Didymella keratinophila]|nr:hypothetical protein E8E11_008995 [Didymella keratinophila]